MATPPWKLPPAQAASGRRRGAVLERAILDAALEELGAVGWNGLTMEGVAARARTGKSAVYRRWPSKEELVTDALRAGLPRFTAARDLGSVRDELLAFCGWAREALRSRFGLALRSVLHECDPLHGGRVHDVVLDVVVKPTAELLGAIVERGVERGEVPSAAANSFVRDAIPAMVMYRLRVRESTWDAPEIREMIDRLMMPLLRADSP
ncbi:TetR/AcrR family transcriptional regulator [Streptomyces sp. NBC_00631]|uniref:TetR/AcrR family transcriptional regulator n=1 Tax=Streptomyces sp. NBC_00631 TaxID=2975793 RepID=UPI0030E25DC7